MANLLTNVSQAMLEDEVLQPLRLDRSPINAFSYSVDEKARAVGDTTKVNILSAKTSKTYNGSFATGDGNTTTSTNVTLTAPVMSDWEINPLLEGIPTAARWAAEALDAAQAVVEGILTSAFGLFTLDNIGNVNETDVVAVSAANYDSDDQADLWGMLAGKKVKGRRSAIHSIPYITSLMKDDSMKDADKYGNSDLVQTGQMGTLYGAKQFYTDLFPSALTDENTEVIYTGAETIAIGFAQPLDPVAGLQNAAGVQLRVMVDPTTGIPLIYRAYVDANTGIYHGAVFTMRGQAFLRNSAVRIVSALTT